MQLLTYDTMSENIDMTDATYCKTCSLRIAYSTVENTMCEQKQ